MRRASQLPGINIALGLSYAAGQQDLYQRMLERFVSSQREFLAQLQSHCNSGALNEAIRLAHTVRGIAGSLGAQSLAQAAQVMESYLASGGKLQADSEEWLGVWQPLQKAFVQVWGGLEQYFLQEEAGMAARGQASGGESGQVAQSSEPPQSGPSAPSAPSAQCQQARGELLRLLAQSSLDAVEYFASHKALLALDSALADSLAQALEEFDFDAALAVLQPVAGFQQKNG